MLVLATRVHVSSPWKPSAVAPPVTAEWVRLDPPGAEPQATPVSPRRGSSLFGVSAAAAGHRASPSSSGALAGRRSAAGGSREAAGREGIQDPSGVVGRSVRITIQRRGRLLVAHDPLQHVARGRRSGTPPPRCRGWPGRSPQAQHVRRCGHSRLSSSTPHDGSATPCQDSGAWPVGTCRPAASTWPTATGHCSSSPSAK